MADVHTSEVDIKLASVNVVLFSQIFQESTTYNKTTFLKSKHKNVEGGWKLKFIFCFMETTHKPLHIFLVKVWYNKISWTYRQVLFESLFVWQAVKYGDNEKFWAFAGTEVAPSCEEFWNVQFHIFAYYLTCYVMYRGYADYLFFRGTLCIQTKCYAFRLVECSG
jgi:hypothetical protein